MMTHKAVTVGAVGATQSVVPTPTNRAVRDNEDSTGEVVEGAHGCEGARGPALGCGRGCSEGGEGVNEDGSGMEAHGTAAAADRVLCEQGFDHCERFGDARRATNAFKQLEGGGSSDRARAPLLREDLWHVFTFECM